MVNICFILEFLIWGNFDISKLNNVSFKLDYVSSIDVAGGKIGEINYDDIEFEIEY